MGCGESTTLPSPKGGPRQALTAAGRDKTRRGRGQGPSPQPVHLSFLPPWGFGRGDPKIWVTTATTTKLPSSPTEDKKLQRNEAPTFPAQGFSWKEKWGPGPGDSVPG